jgi:NADH-quinone oxidoreductase subunit I
MPYRVRVRPPSFINLQALDEWPREPGCGYGRDHRYHRYRARRGGPLSGGAECDGFLEQSFLVDLFQGLWVTFRSQHPRTSTPSSIPPNGPKWPSGTAAPPGSTSTRKRRDAVHRVQPVRAGLSGEPDRGRQRAQRKDEAQGTGDVHLRHSRCMFCGLCEDACPVDALELTQDFELASYTREGADLGPADA